MKRVARNLLFSLIMATVVLGGAELFLRLVSEPPLYLDEQLPVWRLNPEIQRPVLHHELGTSFDVRTNSRGWRGEEPEPGGLLCLGDSTTFGWGVAEEEAWPALLGATNGGVPGYSTHQGLARMEEALEAEPARVLLGFVVRDAELAPVSDHLRPEVAASPSLELMRLLRSARPAAPSPDTLGEVHRVPPARYRDNLVQLVEQVRAAGAEPLLLAFPMQERPEAHFAALVAVSEQERVPLFAPELEPSHFFAEDPIHLTVEGNARLAEELAPWL